MAAQVAARHWLRPLSHASIHSGIDSSTSSSHVALKSAPWGLSLRHVSIRTGKRSSGIANAFWSRKKKKDSEAETAAEQARLAEEEEGDEDEEDEEEEEDDEEEEWDEEDEEGEGWADDGSGRGIQGMLARMRTENGSLSGRALPIMLLLSVTTAMLVTGIVALLRVRQRKNKLDEEKETKLGQKEEVPPEFGKGTIVTLRVPEKDIVVGQESEKKLAEVGGTSLEVYSDASVKDTAFQLEDSKGNNLTGWDKEVSSPTFVESQEGQLSDNLEQVLAAVVEERVAEMEKLHGAQIEALKATNEVEARVLKDQADQRKALEEEIKALRLQLAVAKEVAEHLLVGDKRREEDMGVLREQNAELSAYFENLVRQKDEDQLALAELLVGQEAEKEALEKKLQEEMELGQSRQALLDDLEGKLQEAEEERESLTSNLRQALADCQRLASRCAGLELDLEDAKTKRGQVETERTLLVKQLQETQVDMRGLRLSLAQESAKLALAEEKAGEKMIALGVKQEEVERMQAELEELKAVIVAGVQENWSESTVSRAPTVDSQMLVDALAEVQEELARDALLRQAKLAELSRKLAEAPGVLEAREVRGGTYKLHASNVQETEELRRRLTDQDARMDLFKKQADAALAGRDRLLAVTEAKYQRELAAKEAEITSRLTRQVSEAGGLDSDSEGQREFKSSFENGRYVTQGGRSDTRKPGE